MMDSAIEITRVQTITWIHYIADKVVADPTSPSDLERKTGIPKQYWSRYLKWAHNGNYNPPSEEIRNDLEAGKPEDGIIKIEGSSKVYNIGPENAPLWDALWSDDFTNLLAISRHVPRDALVYETANSRKMTTSELRLPGEEHIYSLVAFFNDHMLRGFTWPTYSCPAWPTVYKNVLLVTALIAAYRYCLIWKRLAFYLPPVGDCLKKALQYDKDTHNTAAIAFSSYGILDYVRQYVFGLTASPEPDPPKTIKPDPIYIPIKFPWLKPL